MAKFIGEEDSIESEIRAGRLETVMCPTGKDNVVGRNRSQAKTHVGFSSDADTLQATILRITGRRTSKASPIPAAATDTFEAELRKAGR